MPNEPSRPSDMIAADQQHHPFYFEARQFAEDLEIPAHEQAEFVWNECTRRAVRAYHDETAPFVREKVRLISTFPGDVVITTGGQLVRSPPKYPPEVAEALRLLDQLIAQVAARYFLFDTERFGQPR